MDGELGGGNMNSVYRRGDSVLRVAGPWTPTVHRYLDHLAAAGVVGIPTPRGIEGDREVLAFVEGEVPGYPMPAWVWTDAALGEAARLLRALHDASIDFDSSDATWQPPAREPAEVVCHNDFAPHNLVFAAGHVVGAIDFDFCAPGPRIWDIANLAVRMIPLTTERHEGAPMEDEWRSRIELLLGEYGSDLGWATVLRTVVPRLRDAAEFSRAKAIELGKPELTTHARLYDRDAEYLEGVLQKG